MLFEIIRATILGAAPIAIFTFLTLQWSISSGRLNKFTDKAELRKQFKKAAKDRKAAKTPFFSKKSGGDFFHGKIMSFGGGFYGTMALFTYMLIEVGEIWDFLGKVIQPSTWVNNLGIELIVNFIINSVLNLVAAFIWFVTLPKYVDMDPGFVWLAAAYGGYMTGLWLIRAHGDDIWEDLVQRTAKVRTSIRAKAGFPNKNSAPSGGSDEPDD